MTDASHQPRGGADWLDEVMERCWPDPSARPYLSYETGVEPGGGAGSGTPTGPELAKRPAANPVLRRASANDAQDSGGTLRVPRGGRPSGVGCSGGGVESAVGSPEQQPTAPSGAPTRDRQDTPGARPGTGTGNGAGSAAVLRGPSPLEAPSGVGGGANKAEQAEASAAEVCGSAEADVGGVTGTAPPPMEPPETSISGPGGEGIAPVDGTGRGLRSPDQHLVAGSTPAGSTTKKARAAPTPGRGLPGDGEPGVLGHLDTSR